MYISNLIISFKFYCYLRCSLLIWLLWNQIRTKVNKIMRAINVTLNKIFIYMIYLIFILQFFNKHHDYHAPPPSSQNSGSVAKFLLSKLNQKLRRPEFSQGYGPKKTKLHSNKKSHGYIIFCHVRLFLIC